MATPLVSKTALSSETDVVAEQIADIYPPKAMMHFEKEMVRSSLADEVILRQASRGFGGWTGPSGLRVNEPLPYRAGEAGCCCVMQWIVPRPSTKSRQAMPTTSRPGKSFAIV